MLKLKNYRPWIKAVRSFLLFMFFVFEIPRFSCLKTLLNITHDSKEISNPDTVLLSFMTTGRVRLSHFEKILITVSGAHLSSRWVGFYQILWGREINW